MQQEFTGSIVVAHDWNGDGSNEAQDAWNNWQSFTTHDGFDIQTKYRKLPKNKPTTFNPDGAQYIHIKFSSGANSPTKTPDLYKKFGLDPADEGVTYKVVGKDTNVQKGEDGYNGVYGSHDSAQVIIEVLDPDADFTLKATAHDESSINLLKTDAVLDVIGGGYVAPPATGRSDESHVTSNGDESFITYHEDEGTHVDRINRLLKADPHLTYLGDGGKEGSPFDNLISFLNPEILKTFDKQRGIHGNGSYLRIKLRHRD